MTSDRWRSRQAASRVLASGLAALGGNLACSGGDAGDRGDASAALRSVGPAARDFHIGADITWAQRDEHYGARFLDSDGTDKDILQLLSDHGFNSVRLRTFVDPRAADGYDQVDGFGDLAHTVTMGQRIKQAGMSFFLALHYSDNWADPGKQCVPIAWQQDTFEQLTDHLRAYTLEVVQTLTAAGARPDFVQVGNEITWGMLFNVCDAAGLPTGEAPTVNGGTANWDNLAALLRAGIEAVREVDPSIEIVLQIDKGGNLGFCLDWIANAQARGVSFDIFAGTTYVRYQGQPSLWQQTYFKLVSAFPELSFMIPEYSNESATDPPMDSTIRLTNDIVFQLPEHQGVGTWFYEPAHPFVGNGLFEPLPGRDVSAAPGDGAGEGAAAEGPASEVAPGYVAVESAMAEYDAMRAAFGERLWRAAPVSP